jgi:ABC-type microcin C transport system permease subunit YejE
MLMEHVWVSVLDSGLCGFYSTVHVKLVREELIEMYTAMFFLYLNEIEKRNYEVHVHCLKVVLQTQHWKNNENNVLN